MDKKRTTSSFRAMSTERKLESIFLFVTGRCKYTDFSIPVKGYNAKLCFTTYNKNKKAPFF